ncbi:MAG: Flp pilus assembly complex ATPase component TadA [Deltaproteobacteria bacterium]|nr:Flp pilus assembly complex ATPase component TadA [Deltaproteobacteria bacterium]
MMGLQGASSERVSNWLFGAAGALVVAGAVSLVVGSAPESWLEFGLAVRWYVVRQLRENPLALPATILAGVATLAWLVVSRRAARRYEREEAAGALPAREVGVLEDRALVRWARSLLEPELTRTHPRVERVADVLLGAPVDVGASELVLEPGPMVVDLSLRMSMDRVTVTTMSRELYAQVLVHFRRVLGLAGDGEGQLDLRSADAVEQLRVVLRSGPEGTVMRVQVLGRAGATLTLDELKLPPAVHEELVRALGATRGLVLVSGPAGHGVGTTLYAALHHVNHERQRTGLIATLEETVRHALPFAHQTELGRGHAPRVLEKVLARPAKVLLVRPAAEAETVRMVVEAARTRLVLATLGSVDAREAILKAVDCAGATAVGETLLLSVGQRLARRLCPACRVEARPSADEMTVGGVSSDAVFYASRGCQACGYTGLAGRHPIFEALRRDEELARALQHGAPAAALAAALDRRAAGGLMAAGLAEAGRGHLSLAELSRVVEER